MLALGHRAGERTRGGPECGPPGTEHLSDVPAQGLHVLTAVDGPLCAVGEASFRASVSVDGFAIDGDAPMVAVSCSADDGASLDHWLLEGVRCVEKYTLLGCLGCSNRRLKLRILIAGGSWSVVDRSCTDGSSHPAC